MIDGSGFDLMSVGKTPPFIWRFTEGVASAKKIDQERKKEI